MKLNRAQLCDQLHRNGQGFTADAIRALSADEFQRRTQILLFRHAAMLVSPDWDERP